MLNPEMLKPSTVLAAMVSGAIKSRNDPHFTAAMKEVSRGQTIPFDEIYNKCIYNKCIVTVTLVEIFGQGKSPSELMLDYSKTPSNQSNFMEAYLRNVIELDPLSIKDSLSINKLEILEQGIDLAQVGEVSELIDLLTGELTQETESFDGRWSLEDENWEEQISVVQSTIVDMIAIGL
jgi:hypothetical protein